MGHIIKKRTKFQKGNFRPAWDRINSDLTTLGRIKPSEVYKHLLLPYCYTIKITVLESKHLDFKHYKSIMDWLA